MFTGIVERSVRVIGASEFVQARRLTLVDEWGDLRRGESIAVNGCCLTVAELAAGEVGFDVVPETLSKTNLGLIKEGDRVHVERAMKIGDRIDGHFVQGHVDCTARLVKTTYGEGETRLLIEPPADMMRYVTPKGSVTLDGVSLTVAAIEGGRFEVALIPTTLQITELGNRPQGWPINFEADVISKTVVVYLERTGRPGI